MSKSERMDHWLHHSAIKRQGHERQLARLLKDIPKKTAEQESCLILTPSCLSSLMIRHAARGSPTGQRDYLPFLCLVSLSGCSAVSFGQPLISLHLAKRLCLLLRCFHRSIFVSFALLFSLGYLSFALPIVARALVFLLHYDATNDPFAQTWTFNVHRIQFA